LNSSSTTCAECGFPGEVPDPDAVGVSAYGWLAFTISGSVYYVPAWR
jgi:hypothetical protein